MKNKRYLTLLLVALTCTKALAFKQGIHENITDTVLKKTIFTRAPQMRSLTLTTTLMLQNHM